MNLLLKMGVLDDDDCRNIGAWLERLVTPDNRNISWRGMALEECVLQDVDTLKRAAVNYFRRNKVRDPLSSTWHTAVKVFGPDEAWELLWKGDKNEVNTDSP